MSEGKFDLILVELKEMKQDQQSMKADILAMKEDFQEMKQDQQSMKEDFKEMKDSQHSMQQDQSQMHHRFDVLEAKVDQTQSEIVSIKESIARIDRSVHEDVVTILRTIERSDTEKGADITVLNHRLFKVEATVQQMIEQ